MDVIEEYLDSLREIYTVEVSWPTPFCGSDMRYLAGY
jgi:hypothetical protein